MAKLCVCDICGEKITTTVIHVDFYSKSCSCCKCIDEIDNMSFEPISEESLKIMREVIKEKFGKVIF